MRGLTRPSLLPENLLRRAEQGNTFVELATTIDLTTGKINGEKPMPRLHPLELRQVTSEEDDTPPVLPAASAGPSKEPKSSQELEWGRGVTEV